MIYGYARCSTNEKMQDINRQVRELKQQGATDTTIYLEYESGMKADQGNAENDGRIQRTGTKYHQPESKKRYGKCKSQR